MKKPLSLVFDPAEIMAEAHLRSTREHWNGMLALVVSVKGIALVVLWHALMLLRM
jgi:hypothetical protein